jgi:putative ABC transport system permease protein
MAAIEVALCTILLITGGLLLASFTRLMQVEKGFEPTHVVTQDLSFLSPKYVGEVRGRVVRNLMEQLRQIPGAQAVGATSQLPLNGESWISGLRDPDQPVPTGEESAVANFRFVTPGYWDAMGIRLREGRYFRESDWDSRVAVITDRAAQQLWPGQSAIGRHVRGIGPRKPALEVVGVTSDVPAGGLEQTPPMMVYEPYALIAPVGIVIAVRTDRDSGAMMRAVRGVLASADPEMPLPPARSMTQIVNESVAPRKFEMYLAGGFAVAGLLVALLGLYGMISFSMARRTAELGIRIALGAPGRQLVGMAVRQGMRPAILGLAAGVALSLAGGNLVSSQLFGVTARDPLTYAVVVILMLTVALCACWIPARRVTRIDPLRALRCE